MHGTLYKSSVRWLHSTPEPKDRGTVQILTTPTPYRILWNSAEASKDNAFVQQIDRTVQLDDGVTGEWQLSLCLLVLSL